MSPTAEDHRQQALAAISEAHRKVEEAEEQLFQARLYQARMIQLGRDHCATWAEIAHETGAASPTGARTVWLPYIGMEGMPAHRREDKATQCPVCAGEKVAA